MGQPTATPSTAQTEHAARHRVRGVVVDLLCEMDSNWYDVARHDVDRSEGAAAVDGAQTKDFNNVQEVRRCS